MKIETLYLNFRQYNYLITKQSAKLNKNYYTRKSEVNIHKSHEDKSINLSLGELP